MTADQTDHLEARGWACVRSPSASPQASQWLYEITLPARTEMHFTGWREPIPLLADAYDMTVLLQVPRDVLSTSTCASEIDEIEAMLHLAGLKPLRLEPGHARAIMSMVQKDLASQQDEPVGAAHH